MRIRYRYVTYRYTDGSQQQLERHYRQLVHDALRQSHQSILQRSATWRPLADIRESTEMMTIKIELAGVREEDIEVTLYEEKTNSTHSGAPGTAGRSYSCHHSS